MRAQLRSKTEDLHAGLFCMQEMRSRQTFAQEVRLFALSAGTYWMDSFIFLWRVGNILVVETAAIGNNVSGNQFRSRFPVL